MFSMVSNPKWLTLNRPPDCTLITVPSLDQLNVSSDGSTGEVTSHGLRTTDFSGGLIVFVNKAHCLGRGGAEERERDCVKSVISLNLFMICNYDDSLP